MSVNTKPVYYGLVWVQMIKQKQVLDMLNKM